MSKYWRKTVTGDYSAMFKNWQISTLALPEKGSVVMGRIKGTNTAIAVHYSHDGNWYSTGRGPSTVGSPLAICQWISFTDYADIRSCVWRQM